MGRCNHWGWRQAVSRAAGRFTRSPDAPITRYSDPIQSDLFADRRIAQRARPRNIDLPGDQAVVVDAASDGVFRAGINDLLESSIFVDDAKSLVPREMVGHDHTRIIDTDESGSVLGAWKIDGSELPVLPQEAVADEATGVRPYHRPA